MVRKVVPLFILGQLNVTTFHFSSLTRLTPFKCVSVMCGGHSFLEYLSHFEAFILFIFEGRAFMRYNAFQDFTDIRRKF